MKPVVNIPCLREAVFFLFFLFFIYTPRKICRMGIFNGNLCEVVITFYKYGYAITQGQKRTRSKIKVPKVAAIRVPSIYPTYLPTYLPRYNTYHHKRGKWMGWVLNVMASLTALQIRGNCSGILHPPPPRLHYIPKPRQALQGKMGILEDADPGSERVTNHSEVVHSPRKKMQNAELLTCHY